MWQLAVCWLAIVPKDPHSCPLTHKHDEPAPTIRHQPKTLHTPKFPPALPSLQHPYVERYLHYFQNQGKHHFEKWLTRSGLYEPRMRSVLRQKGLPEDLIYVALIESGFAANAISSASATGFWQIMPGTAQMLGLKRNAWLDERRDFVRATEAAANYLAQLYQRFQDWHLALAAYNAGFGRIQRSLQRHGVTSYAELLAITKALPEETRHYVPKLMAAMQIAKDPSKYGFAHIIPAAPIVYRSVAIGTHVDLQQIATRLAIPLQALRQLNPGLIQDQILPNLKQQLRVPHEYVEPLRHLLSSAPEQLAPKYTQHVVRKGDTLSHIAKRYGISLQALKDHNPKQGKWLQPNHRLRIPSKWLTRAIG